MENVVFKDTKTWLKPNMCTTGISKLLSPRDQVMGICFLCASEVVGKNVCKNYAKKEKRWRMWLLTPQCNLLQSLILSLHDFCLTPGEDLMIS